MDETQLPVARTCHVSCSPFPSRLTNAEDPVMVMGSSFALSRAGVLNIRYSYREI
jgi:hypothetical protein